MSSAHSTLKNGKKLAKNEENLVHKLMDELSVNCKALDFFVKIFLFFNQAIKILFENFFINVCLSNPKNGFSASEMC